MLPNKSWGVKDLAGSWENSICKGNLPPYGAMCLGFRGSWTGLQKEGLLEKLPAGTGD